MITEIRSPSERGTDWAVDYAVNTAMEKLKALANAIDNSDSGPSASNQVSADVVCVPARVISVPNLPRVWPELCVRVMSGRNHDFGSEMMNKFYSQEVRLILGCLMCLPLINNICMLNYLPDARSCGC
jgi:hypothetical protein